MHEADLQHVDFRLMGAKGPYVSSFAAAEGDPNERSGRRRLGWFGCAESATRRLFSCLSNISSFAFVRSSETLSDGEGREEGGVEWANAFHVVATSCTSKQLHSNSADP